MERVTLLIRNEWLHVIGHRIPLITEFAKMMVNAVFPHRYRERDHPYKRASTKKEVSTLAQTK